MNAQVLPKVTFGIIVLNGEPFVRYNLRALYPFAHQIIVVEGAAPAAAAIATSDGHSTDSTLKTLQDFKAQEDTEDKLIIVTAEDEGHPDGFWPGEKNEQSMAYANRATGDYLWQVDVDEFYKPQDMVTVLNTLRENPAITTISFNQITFWGGFDFTTDGWYLHRGWCARGIHRVFKWGTNYRYVTHRPPTILNERGQDLRNLQWLDGSATAKQGLFMYHYSLVFPKQVLEKCAYYGQADWTQSSSAQQWAENNYLQLKDPYRVHNVYDYPSWLQRFVGKHPPQIDALRRDIEVKRVTIGLRRTDDIEKLLHSPIYIWGRSKLMLQNEWDLRWTAWEPQRHRVRALAALPGRALRKGWRLARRIVARLG